VNSPEVDQLTHVRVQITHLLDPVEDEIEKCEEYVEIQKGYSQDDLKRAIRWQYGRDGYDFLFKEL
jgi:hypothetical protein